MIKIIELIANVCLTEAGMEKRIAASQRALYTLHVEEISWEI